MPKLKWWQWTLAGLAGLVVIGALGNLFETGDVRRTAPATTPQSAPPQSASQPGANDVLVSPPPQRPPLAERVRDVSEATSLGGEVLNAKVRVDTPGSDAGLVRDAARSVVDVGRALQRGVAEDAPSVTLVRLEFITGAVDRLGEEGEQTLFLVEFAADDLRRAKFDNLTEAMTLNLASRVIQRRFGADALGAWCRENADEGEGFCSRVTA